MRRGCTPVQGGVRWPKCGCLPQAVHLKGRSARRRRLPHLRRRGCIRFSHLGRRFRRADIAAGGFSVSCASSPLLVSCKGSETSSIVSTEKRLLGGNGGAWLTCCLTQNPLRG